MQPANYFQQQHRRGRLSGAARRTRLNRALWTLSERMAELSKEAARNERQGAAQPAPQITWVAVAAKAGI